MVFYMQASLSTMHRRKQQTLWVPPSNQVEAVVDFEHCLCYHDWQAISTAMAVMMGKPWQKQWRNTAKTVGKQWPQQLSKKQSCCKNDENSNVKTMVKTKATRTEKATTKCSNQPQK